jgi:catechol 2,3-dioxygenase-like lactoylglutathione lyase family enzyme
MTFDSINTLFVAAPDFDAACRPYERLGLRPDSAGNESRFLVGQPHNRVAVRFLAAAGPDSPLVGPTRRALASGRGLIAVGLQVADLDAALGRLASKDVQATSFRDGEDSMAWLPVHDQAGTDLVLVRQERPPQEHLTAAASDPLAHSFPLKRLDHLAAVTHDLEAKTQFWAGVLGVPIAREVVTPAMVIRQLRIGDAVLELLGPASPDSPIRQRPPGLVSMASWEVDDLDEAVRQAREAGFTSSDPAAGPLPGTRIATIQGSELAGVNMQLLQYV